MKVLGFGVAGFLTFSILLSAEVRAIDDPLAVWQQLNPLPTGNPLNSVVFCNGQFIGTGVGPTLLSSADGTNWVTHFVPGFKALAHVAFGGGLYVVVGSGSGAGVILTSTNLDDWTPQTSGTASALNAVEYGNGMFVAVGDAGTLLTSTNGVDWTPRSSGTSGRLGAIAFGNGTFVISSGTSDLTGPFESAVSVSSDGVVWTRKTVGDISYIPAVSFSRGLFHAGGVKWTFSGPPNPNPSLYLSADGTNWIAASIPSVLLQVNILFADDSHDFASSEAHLLTSTDGTNFSVLTTTNFPPIGGLNSISSPSAYAFGNGTFVATTRHTATQATYWNPPDAAPTPRLLDLACGNRVTVAVGGENGLTGLPPYSAILVSSDGLPFAIRTSPVSVALNRIVYGDGLFHAVGMSGAVIRSTNGVQWIQRNASTGNHLWGLTHGKSLWIAAGNSGTITTSPTGQAWTLRFSGTSYDLYGVACDNNLFVAVGFLGTIMTSPDGIVWTVQFDPSLSTLYDVTSGGGLFVAVGENGTIVTSPDGVNWNIQNSGLTDTLKSITFDRGIFVIAGGWPRVGKSENPPPVLLTSTNGVNWIQHNPGTMWSLSGTRSLNGDFFCVGANGIILQNPSAASIRLAGRWNPSASQFQVIMKAGLGQSFRLQSQDALGSGTWVGRAAFVNAPNPVSFLDPTSPLQPARFYRTVSP